MYLNVFCLPQRSQKTLHDLAELTSLGKMNDQYFLDDAPLLDLEIHFEALSGLSMQCYEDMHLCLWHRLHASKPIARVYQAGRHAYRPAEIGIIVNDKSGGTPLFCEIKKTRKCQVISARVLRSSARTDNR